MANSASINNISVDLTELSADTSPQLGGNLDLNSNDITGTGNVNTTGTITASSTITGSTFSGSGASLTNLNASNLASGTIPDARFPSALPAVDGSNLTGINTDLVSDTTPQLGGDLASNGNNINIADDDNINFGNGSDLTIRHQASNNTSYIEETGSGHLVIKGDDTFIQNAAGTTNIARFNDGGGVNLYHNSNTCLLYTSPSPRDTERSRMPSSA